MISRIVENNQKEIFQLFYEKFPIQIQEALYTFDIACSITSVEMLQYLERVGLDLRKYPDFVSDFLCHGFSYYRPDLFYGYRLDKKERLQIVEYLLSTYENMRWSDKSYFTLLYFILEFGDFVLAEKYFGFIASIYDSSEQSQYTSNDPGVHEILQNITDKLLTNSHSADQIEILGDIAKPWMNLFENRTQLTKAMAVIRTYLRRLQKYKDRYEENNFLETVNLFTTKMEWIGRKRDKAKKVKKDQNKNLLQKSHS